MHFFIIRKIAKIMVARIGIPAKKIIIISEIYFKLSGVEDVGVLAFVELSELCNDRRFRWRNSFVESLFNDFYWAATNFKYSCCISLSNNSILSYRLSKNEI